MQYIFRQTTYNSLLTLGGFVFGALNTLVFYVQFLDVTSYGIIAFLLASSTLISPILSGGVQQTLIKHLERDSSKENEKIYKILLQYYTLYLIILGLVFYLGQGAFKSLIEVTTTELEELMVFIWILGLAMAVFEICFAISKIHLKTIFGTFLKELFVRLGISLLLLTHLYVNFSLTTIIVIICGIYVLRVFLMLVYFQKMKIKIRFAKGWVPFENYILKYSLLVIFGAFSTVVFLELDKFMIGRYLEVGQVAVYAVGVYIATIIAIPYRSMQHITNTVTLDYLKHKNQKALYDFTKNSSFHLFLVSGFIFFVLLTNMPLITSFLPKAYEGLYFVVLLIGFTRLLEAIIGIGNAVLIFSNTYTSFLAGALIFGILGVYLNVSIIPIYGINGAALATALTLLGFFTFKLVLLWNKHHIQPFSLNLFKSIAVLLILTVVFSLSLFNALDLWSGLLKLTAQTTIFLLICYKLKWVSSLQAVLKSLLGR